MMGIAVLAMSGAIDSRADTAPATATPPSAPAAKPKDCTATEYRQFDFWLGSWEVHEPDGSLAGTNTLEAILDGCAFVEHWSGAQGGRGTSLNFYDAVAKRWSQTWIDNHGRPLRLDGTFRDDKMVLEGTQTDAEGHAVWNRLTWTPLANHHVRQLWESSKDAGASWSVEFDGDYAPKAGR
jgi:hypothetical protein